MQQVSQAVVDILYAHGHYTLAYIDDLAGAHPQLDGAQGAFHRCTIVLQQLGLVEATEKQQPPRTDMVC